jgi:crotonobetainyl-CoA:carnitine CoA-transferase CaiB-like acyl-CoA transferase
MKPLDGIKVLEIGTALAGPYSATLLSDMGAEVIKLEKPKRGDLIRFTDTHVHGQSGYFLGINRGKAGLTADVRTPEGQEIVRRIAADHDVVIENFRYGKMAEWGLGYGDLKRVNPRLIYCSLSMFGKVNEFDGRSGNDAIAQAYSGILDLTGELDRPPSKTGAPVVDVAGSFLATIAILGAIIQRETSGEGVYIELSLLEAAWAMMPNYIASVMNGSPDFKRLGSGHPQLVPYQAFLAKDGRYVMVGAFHRQSWRQLCKALGRPDLLEDPRFKENWDRLENRDALIPILENEISTKPSDEWIALFREYDLPVAPVMKLADSIEFFATRADGLAVTAHHAELGDLRMLRTPFRYSTDEPRPLRAAPTLGQDDEEILTRYGYSTDEIAAMRGQGVI